MNKDRIALQLYTVRSHTALDMVGTLAQVAQQGYKAVEFAGFGGVTVPDLRAALDNLGVQAIAAHVGLDDLEANPGQVLADLKALGCTYVVVPHLREERRQGVEQMDQVVDTFTRIGKMCRDDGLKFAYHNHAFEFAPLGDTTVYDVLLAKMDPGLMAFELDLYWVRYAGVDPLAMLRRLTGRVPLVHVKDMTAGETPRDAPVGEGIFDWPAVLEACAAAGAEWYIVEQDHPNEPLADTERSLRNLEKLLSAPA